MKKEKNLLIYILAIIIVFQSIIFILNLNKNGDVEYINNPLEEVISMNIRRKYYESYNVVDMRCRLLGGKFQCSDYPDFKDAITIYTIDHTDIPYLIETNVSRPYRYWRYVSPDGSWGSISEVSFHDAQGNKISGRGMANPEAGPDAIEHAYDGNLLSNFEINQPDGNWLGMDMGEQAVVSSVMVVPRIDDNDVFLGNEYELLYWNGNRWKSAGYKKATGNVIEI
jgi:hypothetical protein